EQGPQLAVSRLGLADHPRGLAHRTSGVGDRRDGRRRGAVRAGDPVGRWCARLPRRRRVRLAITLPGVGGAGAGAMTAPNEGEPHPETLATSEPAELETEELAEPGAEGIAEDTVADTVQRRWPPPPAVRAAPAFVLYLVTAIVLWRVPVVGHL